MVLGSDNLTLYAGAGRVVYRSTDDGRTWDFSLIPVGSGNITALLAHPGESLIVYAQVESAVYRSTDRGKSWVLLETPSGTRSIGASFDFLYAGGNVSLFGSADHGETWHEISGQVGYIRNILPIPGDDSTLYLGQSGGRTQGREFKEGLYLSKDGGSTWRPVPDGGASWRVSDFAVDVSESPNIYVAANGELLRANSLEPKEWAAVGGAGQVATHPTNPQILAVSTGSTVLATLDGGQSWVGLHEAGHLIGNTTYAGLPEARISPRPILIGPGSPGTICIGSEGGVWCHRGVGD